MVMIIQRITNNCQYEKALHRYEEIFKADDSIPDGIEAQYLCDLITAYEDLKFPLEYALADKYFYEAYEEAP
jgi:hypothetical protein